MIAITFDVRNFAVNKRIINYKTSTHYGRNIDFNRTLADNVCRSCNHQNHRQV